MPYLLSNPPKTIQGLPISAKRIWIRVFNETYNKTKGTDKVKDERARIAAWGAVKNAGYSEKSGIWKRWE